jgi:hypothetical protein
MIIELERDADRLCAARRCERRHDGTVDPAGHGDDDPRARKRPVQLEIRVHAGALTPDRFLLQKSAGLYGPSINRRYIDP